MALSAIIISLAAIVMSTYSMTKDIQTAPSVSATQRSIGENFNWKLGEVVDVQGNIYAYLGYQANTLRIAKYQNGWIELTYGLWAYEWEQRNITLYPYKLLVEPQYVTNNYLTATFFET